MSHYSKSIVFVILVCFQIFRLIAQDAADWEIRDYNAPDVEIKHYGELYDDDDHLMFLVDKLYPLGWSNEGVFAYYVEYANRDCNCYSGDFKIQNMATNELLWDFSIKDQMKKTLNRDSLWILHYALLKEVLNKFEIAQTETFDIRLGKKLDAMGVVFKAHTTTKYYPKKRLSAITNEKIIAEDLNDNYKVVFRRSYDNFSGILRSKVYGYSMSPFRDVVAIFYQRVINNWESLPNVLTLELIGCQTNQLTFEKN